ncbi:MAG: hypothetical protein R2760_03235 [Chitinophagales bacterium]
MAKLNNITFSDNLGFGLPYGKVLEYENLKGINNFSFTSIPKENIHIVSLKERNTKSLIDELYLNDVLNIIKQEEKYYVKTGNYIGVIYDKEQNIKIEITSRFGDKFLQHILNYINNIYLPDVKFVAIKKESKNETQFQFILAHLFIQSLEKITAVFGLPKIYTTQHENSYKVRGSLDIKHLTNHNIPLRNRLKSNYREQTEVQEIIDVLYNAMSIIDKKFGGIIIARLLSLKNHLKEKKSTRFVNHNVVQQALNHKALLHPSYSGYKQVLRYAEFIINNYDNMEDHKGKIETKAYLINIAELFEIYIEKVLRKGLNDVGWSVFAQKEIDTYTEKFFSRKLKPDIVLEKDNKVIVFDIKYKRMEYRGVDKLGMGDVDRNDFFQIHTYMSYYQNQSDKYYQNQSDNILLGGGLLYPIEGDLDNKFAHSNFFDNDEHFFIIDGINLFGINDETSQEEFKKRENDFIDRIKKIINKNYD